MSELLKRQYAPIPASAWKAIDEEAKRILEGHLSGRAVVDFSGPHGLDHAAENTGRMSSPRQDARVRNASWSQRTVKPLIEVRVPFELDVNELDGIDRGLLDPDLAPLQDACRQISLFEENVLYYGHKEAGIQGMLENSPHSAVVLSGKSETFQDHVEAALLKLQGEGVGGPYDLVLGTRSYSLLQRGDGRGYPLDKRVRNMIGGEILWSPALEGGALVSQRGGDFQMTAGQDLSVGYLSQKGNRLTFFIVETFTFMVMEPAAAAELTLKTK